MSSKSTRGGAVRKKSRGKAVGSGGQGRQALEGRKPTPKAEDRPYHPAGKAKLAKERLDAARKRHGGGRHRLHAGAAQRIEADAAAYRRRQNQRHER